MSDKHEWRKQEKSYYQPKAKPELIDLPEFKFITLNGEGNPNSPEFSKAIEALYALAYTIKMGLKRIAVLPKNYIDWVVYPLEGVWDINDEAKKNFNGVINKDDLVYTIMIRQPEFIDQSYFDIFLKIAKEKKPEMTLLNQIKFESMKEGRCIQMLHKGPFDDEPASFAKMEEFAKEQGFERKSKIHREIYLSDTRKVAPEKLKTVLRFNIK